MRSLSTTIVAFILASAVVGCGGGGGGGSSAPPPPNPLYVSTRGNDSNSGASPDDALRTILQAAQIAQNGYTIIVAPGVYHDSVTTDRAGQVPQGVRFFADVRGTLTGEDAGAVTIRPAHGAGFDISNTGPADVGGHRFFP